MRSVTYCCDRCGMNGQKKDMVVINYTMSKCGEEAVKKTGDLCPTCYDLIYAQYKKFIKNVDEVVEETAKPTQEDVQLQPEVHTAPAIKDDEPCTPNGFDSVSEEAQPCRQGPMSAEERLIIVTLSARGFDSDYIAGKIHRTAKGVSKCLNAWSRKHGDVTEENILWVEGKLYVDTKEENAADQKVEEKEEIPVIRQTDKLCNTRPILNGPIAQRTCGPAPTTDRKRKKVDKEEEEFDGVPGADKKVDVGAICALANAGWTPKDIAREVRQSIEVVKDVLEGTRKR